MSSRLQTACNHGWAFTHVRARGNILFIVLNKIIVYQDSDVAVSQQLVQVSRTSQMSPMGKSCLPFTLSFQAMKGNIRTQGKKALDCNGMSRSSASLCSDSWQRHKFESKIL